MRDKITSDDVIESYLLAIESRPRWAHRYVLLRFLRRFPEHAAALVEYLAIEAWLDAQPETDDQETAESRAVEEAFVRRGMEIARKLLDERRNASTKKTSKK